MSSEVENLAKISVGRLLLPSKMNLYDIPRHHDILNRFSDQKIKNDPQNSFGKNKKRSFMDEYQDISGEFDYEVNSGTKKMKSNTITSHTLFRKKKEISGLELLSHVALFEKSGTTQNYGDKFMMYDTDEYSDNDDTRSVSKEDEYNPSSSPVDIPLNMKYKKLKAGQHHTKKRHRTSIDQLKRLEQIYKNEKMPNQELREILAKELGMTTRRVQIWFQNKRAKEKKSEISKRI